MRSRLDVLRLPAFRVFVAGYATSALGTLMAGVALAFAVLDSGGSPTTLSYVLAARIVPMVAVLPFAGVLGDRFPRRLVMLWADVLRAATQAAIAVLFFTTTTPHIGLLLTLAALGGLGEAVFRPSFDGLVPQLVPDDRRHEANTFLGLVRSTATVAGPALAGLLVVLTDPATVLLIDALTYVPSILALLWIRVPDPDPAARTSMLREMRAGWRQFASLPWLWTITLQFTLFNLLLWAPYLVLGPVSADLFYGGAGAWAAITAAYGAGAIVGGLTVLGWKPARPLLVATAATILWAAPSAALAVRAPLLVVCAGGLVAGIVSAVFGTLWMTAIHQRVPADAMSRVNSYVVFGSFSVGPIGLALAGPAAASTSITTVLLIGVAWQVISGLTLLGVPAIRHFRHVSPARAEPERTTANA
ncbi:MFS transporter [Asanoa siamensis]|uniref:MFS transporter n=1 Tax=Asanoa siamensis TaxID=926357 RepID=A0ABQ4CKB7_9ACTN|nr:MFS transporter [Asanoa siamensis]GIF71733.1 MFS transporter [Asanoa siamensis]